MCSRQVERVQRAGAIAPDDHVPRQKILHRTISGVKLNRTIIIDSELAYRNQILNKLRRNQNIIKTERRVDNCSTSGSNGEQRAITDNNRGRSRIPRESKVRKSAWV